VEWSAWGIGMGKTITFGEVLESADQLTLDEQTSLLGVLRGRVTERRRVELAEDIQNAHQEFQEGRCRPVTPSELIQEILS